MRFLKVLENGAAYLCMPTNMCTLLTSDVDTVLFPLSAIMSTDPALVSRMIQQEEEEVNVIVSKIKDKLSQHGVRYFSTTIFCVYDVTEVQLYVCHVTKVHLCVRDVTEVRTFVFITSLKCSCMSVTSIRCTSVFVTSLKCSSVFFTSVGYTSVFVTSPECTSVSVTNTSLRCVIDAAEEHFSGTASLELRN